MIAHIRNGVLIQQYRGDTGWVTLEDGNKMSPPVLGTYGNDKIVPVVEEINDTSTGTVSTVRTDTGWQVESDRVYRLITVRDMTAQEIADQVTAEIDNADAELTNDRRLKALATAIWHTNKGTVPAQALSSPAAYKQWLKSLM